MIIEIFVILRPLCSIDLDLTSCSVNLKELLISGNWKLATLYFHKLPLENCRVGIESPCLYTNSNPHVSIQIQIEIFIFHYAMNFLIGETNYVIDIWVKITYKGFKLKPVTYTVFSFFYIMFNRQLWYTKFSYFTFSNFLYLFQKHRSVG